MSTLPNWQQQLSSCKPKQKTYADPTTASQFKRPQKRGIFQRLFQKHSEEHSSLEQQGTQAELAQTERGSDSGSCFSSENSVLASDASSKEGFVDLAPSSGDVLSSKTQQQPVASSSPLYCAIEDTATSQQQPSVTAGAELPCCSLSPLYCTIQDAGTEPPLCDDHSSSAAQDPIRDLVAETVLTDVGLDAGTSIQALPPCEVSLVQIITRYSG